MVCRDLIAQFVSNTFPGPIYPGYAERLAAGTFEVTPSSPGFPVSGVSHLNLLCINTAAVALECVVLSCNMKLCIAVADTVYKLVGLWCLHC